jgi:hypothetical protein
MQIQEKALKDIHVARACKERLRKQIDLLDIRADTAVAVEQQNIKELERKEDGRIIEFPKSKGTSLYLSAST